MTKTGPLRFNTVSGLDTLTGQTLCDIVSYAQSDAAVSVDLRADISGFQPAGGGHATGDILSGMEGVIGSAFADTLTGDDGANLFRGGAGADSMAGGAGLDLLDYLGSSAGVSVTLQTSDGGQTVSGGDAQGDVVSGFEHVSGSRFGDLLQGGAGFNRLEGRGGDDTILGGGGYDIIIGGAGADHLDGGDGIDLLSYATSWGAVQVDLRPGGDGLQSASGGHASGDTLRNFEHVSGSRWGDVLQGDGGHNRLLGRQGNDTINGGGGHDRIAGGAGADDLRGGGGFDTLNYSASGQGVFVDLRADLNGLQQANGGHAEGDVIRGFEKVIGSSHEDVLVAGTRFSALQGGDGADTFVLATEPLGGRADRIEDFTVGEDIIAFDQSVFASLIDQDPGGGGGLNDQFPGQIGPGEGSEVGPDGDDETATMAQGFLAQNSSGEATEEDHRLIYQTDTGTLWYDADGTRDQHGAVKLLTLEAGLALSEADFALTPMVSRAPVARDAAVTVSAFGPDYIDIPLGDLNTREALTYHLDQTPDGFAALGFPGQLYFAGKADFGHLRTGQSVTQTRDFYVTDSDGQQSETATLTITIEGAEDAPEALPDIAQAYEDTPLVIAPLGNDRDLDGGPLRIVHVEPVPQGSVEIAADGQTLTFTPARDFNSLPPNGNVTLTYQIEDDTGLRDRAEITVFVTPVNDAPVAQALTGGVDEGAELTLTPIATDHDSSLDGRVEVQAEGLIGQASVQSGAIRYIASDQDSLSAGQTRQEVFTYTVADPSGAVSEAAHVTVTVTGTDDPLTARDDAYTLAEDTPTTLTPLDNDSDMDLADTLTLTGIEALSQGRATISEDGQSILFTPPEDWFGTTTLTYSVTSSGGTTEQADITLTVTPVNDAPEISGPIALSVDPRVAGADFTALVPLPIHDDPLDEYFYSFELIKPDDEQGTGQIAWDAANAEWVFLYSGAPFSDQVLTDSYSYTVTDADGLSATGSIEATTQNLNLAPQFYTYFGREIEGAEDSTVTGEILFYDPNQADTASLTGIRGVQNGTAQINADGQSVSFTPDTDWNGQTTFQVQATDSTGLSSGWADVTATVTPVTDTPQISFEATPIAGKGNSFAVTVTGSTGDMGEAETTMLSLTLEAFDARGNLRRDFVDDGRPDLESTIDSLSHDFVITLPDGYTDDLTLRARSLAVEGRNGGYADATEDLVIRFDKGADQDVSATHGFTGQSIWGAGAQTRHIAGVDIGGSVEADGQLIKNLYTAGGTYAGFGATSAVSVDISGIVEIDAALRPEVWVEGGGVDGQISYTALLTPFENSASGGLSFETEASANLPLTGFSAGSPNAGFDVTLDSLSFMAASYFRLWGYAQVHYGAGSSGPKPDLAIRLPETGVDVAGLVGGDFSLAEYDGTRLKLLEGTAYNQAHTSISRDFSAGATGNELGSVTLTKPTLTTVSTAIQGGSVAGSSARDFANVELDLDGIAATIKGIKNPVDQSINWDGGILSFNAWFEALDLDLRMDLDYGQEHLLTPGDLQGTLTMLETGDRFDFVFGETLSVGAREQFENEDGDVLYTVSMTPSAQFQTKARMVMDLYDHFEAVNAGGAIGIGIDLPGIPSSFGINTGGSLFSTRGTLVDQEFTFDLASSDFALALAALESETLIA